MNVARSIEDNVLKLCADMVSNCAVVGHLKPAPVLFVEPVVDDTDGDTLKREIIKRTAAFNERLFAHERITSPDCIVVVPRGNLPRTSVRIDHFIARRFADQFLIGKGKHSVSAFLYSCQFSSDEIAHFRRKAVEDEHSKILAEIYLSFKEYM